MVTPIVNGMRGHVIHASPNIPGDERMFIGEVTPVAGLALDGRLQQASAQSGGATAAVCVSATITSR